MSKPVVTFQAISDFVSQLNDLTEGEDKGIELYHTIIKMTPLSKVSRSINSFTEFITPNTEAILKRDTDQLEGNIVYTENKIEIDIKKILKSTSVDNQNVIWEHLLSILACIDPKMKLNVIEAMKKPVDNETKVIGNMINTIKNNVEINEDGPPPNPMELLNTFMQNGVLSSLVGELQQGVNDGSIDIGKMVGSMQSMMHQPSAN